MTQSDAEAVKWYRKAARGHAGGLFNLGWMFEMGRGVPPNHKIAADYRKAVAQDHANAVVRLATATTTAGGVPKKDLNKAAELYRQAADMGNADGMYHLAWMYENNEGGREGRRGQGAGAVPQGGGGPGEGESAIEGAGQAVSHVVSVPTPALTERT